MDDRRLTLVPRVLCHCGVLTLEVRFRSRIEEGVHAVHVRLCQHSFMSTISMDTRSTLYEAYLHHNLDKIRLNPSEQVDTTDLVQ